MKDYVDLLKMKDRSEIIRNKKIEEMTLEDSIFALWLLFNNNNYYPCGYSHTCAALMIIEKELGFFDNMNNEVKNGK